MRPLLFRYDSDNSFSALITATKTWIRPLLILWLAGAAFGQVHAQSSPSFKSSPITTVQFDELYEYTIQTSDPDNDFVSVQATALPAWLSLTHQPVGLVTIFAGSGSGRVDGTGTAASFNDPKGMAFDSNGNLFVVDQDNYRIRKITPEGVVSHFAGFLRGYDDGPAHDAEFRGMRGMAIDANDNLYIADEYRIRKMTPDGIVTTIAGSFLRGYNDGTGSDARFESIFDLDLDSQGNLYVADYGNNRIRKVTQEGIVSTFVGSGSGTNQTGTGTGASIWSPQSLVIDESDNIYVGNYISSRIVKITPQGVVSAFFGTSIDRPNDMVIDKDGNLYVGDQHRIRKISPQGVSTIVAGSSSGSADGTGLTAQFKNIGGIALDPLGNLFIADENHLIRKLNTTSDYLLSGDPSAQEGNFGIFLTASDGNGGSAFQNFNLQVVVPRTTPSFASTPATSVGDDRDYQYSVIINDPEQGEDVTVTAVTTPDWLSFDRTYEGVVTTIAGGGTGTTSNGSGTGFNLGSPVGITIDSKGNIYFIPRYELVIKKMTPDGVVSTFAGARDPALPQDADGTGTNARFSGPIDLTIDQSDNIYVADENSDLIRKISPEGVVSTFLGAPNNTSYIADGTGSEVRFVNLRAIDIDGAGNLYVIDNSTVRRVTQQGVASTLNTGDYTWGGPGEPAYFTGITAIAADPNGNVYFTGSGSKSIRKIDPNGVVSNLAGLTGVGDPIDGTGVEATFSQPYSLTVDPKGNIYVQDNIWIRKVTPDGVVTTIAGGIDGFADGTGTEVGINRAEAIVADNYGNIYIGDTGNRRIRKMTTNGWVLKGDPRDQLGVHNVNLKVDDGDGGIANQSFTITVSDTSPPEFTSGLSAVFTENKVGTVYTIIATDSNPVTTVSYSLGSDHDEALFTLIQTGELIFKTPPDFENPADADKNNTYLVQVKASDGMNEATQLVVITVTNESDVDPVFTSDPITSVNEGESYTYQIVTFDGDDDDMVVTGNNLPAWLSINTTDWVVSTLAGSGTAELIDGQGTEASFNNPYGLAVDSQDNIYVVENGNHTIRKVSPDGVVTIFAGSGTKESRNGTGVLASFDTPVGIAVDQDDNLYVTENEAHTIKKIDPNGVVSTFAGAGYTGLTNGYGTYATFRNPWGVAVDNAGNIFVADYGNHWIRKITPGGLVSTFAGNGTLGSADGMGTDATFNNPAFLDFDASNNLYVTDAGNHKVRKITPEGLVSTLAGSGTLGDADGTGTGASFRNPYGIAATAKGVIYVADQSNHKIRRISQEGIVTTIAGSSTQGSAEGTGTEASFNFPFGLTLDKNGNLYVSDSPNQLIRKMDAPKHFLVGDTQEQVGDHSLSLTVTDESGAVGNQNFTLTVNDITDPVFTSGTAVSFAENGTGTAYTAVATDAGEVTYRLGNTKDENLFKIEDGNVSFLTAPDFENPDDADVNNVYLIEVIASDGTNEVSLNIAITVTDEADDAPVFTSSDNVSFEENSASLAHTVVVTDDSPVNFSLGIARDESHFSIYTIIGGKALLFFNSAPDFENPTDKDANNSYEVEVIAKDDIHTVSQFITVNVTDVDDIPAVFTVPVSYAENGTGSVYTASVVDNSNISYSLGTMLDESLFNISEGVITFKNAPDFENPLDSDQDNVYEVKLIAREGAEVVCLVLYITIIDELEDVTPPAAPVITHISEDTGMSSTDGVTSDNTIVINGEAEPNATVELFNNGRKFATRLADNEGKWKFDIQHFELAEATFNPTAEAIDASGNRSDTSEPFRIVIDFTAPAKPVITGITDDTGISESDGITNDKNISIIGTAEPNASVEVFTQFGPVRKTQADANGDWVLDITDITLVEIMVKLTAEAEDLAGNVSVKSDVFTLMPDFTAPAKPVITGITDDTGASDSDGITSDKNVSIMGTAEPNTSVEVFTQFGPIRKTQADGNGDWVLDITDITLVEIMVNLTAEAEDAAGNVSAKSDVFKLTPDFTAPAKPVITGVTDDTGASDSDGITNDKNIIISGTAEPNASVEVFTQYGSIRKTQADGNGDWVLDITDITLVEIVVRLTAEAVDAAGNVSPKSDVFVLTPDFTAPGVTIDVANISAAGYTIIALFDEPVSGLTLGEISVTGGSASNLVQDDPMSYSFLVSLSGATADIQITAGSAQDVAGNDNTVSNLLNLNLPGTRAQEGFNNLRDQVNSEKISLYPNPASNVLTIDLSELSADEVDVFLYDAAGSPVFTRRAYDQKTLKLDVSTYTSGMYIVQVYDGLQVIRKKVMVKK